MSSSSSSSAASARSKGRSSASSSSSCCSNMLADFGSWYLLILGPDRHRHHAVRAARPLGPVLRPHRHPAFSCPPRLMGGGPLSSPRRDVQKQGRFAWPTSPPTSSSSAPVRPGSATAALLATYGRGEHGGQPLSLAGQYAARPHHQSARHGGAARSRHARSRRRAICTRHAAGPDGRERLLHLARRRGDRPDAKLGQASAVARRASAVVALPHERHAADLHGAAAVQDRLFARHAGAHVDRLSAPRAGRRAASPPHASTG